MLKRKVEELKRGTTTLSNPVEAFIPNPEEIIPDVEDFIPNSEEFIPIPELADPTSITETQPHCEFPFRNPRKKNKNKRAKVQKHRGRILARAPKKTPKGKPQKGNWYECLAVECKIGIWVLACDKDKQTHRFCSGECRKEYTSTHITKGVQKARVKKRGQLASKRKLVELKKERAKRKKRESRR